MKIGRANYLPFSGGTLTGDLGLGTNTITFSDLALLRHSATQLKVMDNTETSFKNLMADAFDFLSKLRSLGSSAEIETLDSDGAYISILARDTTSALAEIARFAGASTSYFNTLFGRLRMDAVLATLPIYLRKASDEIVNNSDTLQNDDDLVLAVGANDVWLIHLVLFVISPSVTPEIDYVFAVPSGGAVRGIAELSPATVSAFWDKTAEETLPVDTTEKYAFQIMLYIGGGTAGNLQLQWAQHTATAEDTKVKANSFMLCHRLA